MPTIPCISKIDSCLPCDDEPILNISAEAADVDRYISRFAFLNPFPPIRQYPDFDDQGGGIFLQIGCMRWCWSTISQDDADDCARRQAVECAFNPLIPNVPTPDEFHPNRIAIYTNQAVTGTYTCPDGNLFSYTIAANTIAALTPGTANAIAFALAKQRAKEHRVCISNLDDPICVDTWATKQITASGPYVAVFPATDRWELVSGAVPDGMTLETGFTSDGISLSGIPTTIGEYQFRVRCTISTFGSPGYGDFMEKVFTVKIVGITETSPLPDATLGTAYSQQLHASGSTLPEGELWSITSGTLPDGLSLSPQGLIEGTPSGALAGYSFTVQAQFPVGNTTAVCSKQFTITTIAGVGLLAYWAFEDAPPNYDDSTGSGNTLLHFLGDAPTSMPGIIGNGAQLTSNDPPFVGDETILRITSFSGTPTSPNGWTVFGWFNSTFGNQRTAGILQVDSTDFISSLVLSLVAPAGISRLRLDLISNGPLVSDSVFSQLLVAGSNFWVMWWDESTGVASLQVNNGAVFNVPSVWMPSSSPINNPQLFSTSGQNAAVLTMHVVDETGVVPKVLTAQQRTDLYNAGVGVTWPQVQTIVQS